MRVNSAKGKIIQLARTKIAGDQKKLEGSLGQVSLKEKITKSDFSATKARIAAYVKDLKSLKTGTNPRISLARSQHIDGKLKGENSKIEGLKKELAAIASEKFLLLNKSKALKAKDESLNTELLAIKQKETSCVDAMLEEEQVQTKVASYRSSDSSESINLDLGTGLIGSLNFMNQAPTINAVVPLNELQNVSKECFGNSKFKLHEQWSNSKSAGLVFTYVSSAGQEIRVSLESNLQKGLSLELDKLISPKEEQQIREIYKKSGFKITRFSYPKNGDSYASQ